jgi:hypothetical protein
VSDVDRFPTRDDVLRILETVPVQGERDVDPAIRLELCLSAPVDPRSILDEDVYVSSGEVPYDVEVSLELIPWTGPGSAALDPGATAPWCPGSVLAMAPEIALEPGLLFRLRLRPFARGWDGEELDTTQEGWVPESGTMRYYLEFTVADAEGTTTASGSTSGDTGAGSGTGGDEEPPPPTLTGLFAPGEVFDPARSTCSCHRDPDELAFSLLDLSDPVTAYAGLVLETRPRDTGFPMVSPRLPSESFLVHKLVRTEDGEPLRGVLGDAMPQDAPLPYADYVAIARWIEAGAMP